MKGEKIARSYGFELVPKFFDLLYVFENWDRIKRIASLYDYHEKYFLETLRKIDDNVALVNIVDHMVHVIKDSNEFEIILYNPDSVKTYKEKHFLKTFLLNIFDFRGGKVYFNDVLVKSSAKKHELHFKVRKFSLTKTMTLTDGREVTYYPGLSKIKKPVVLGKGADNSLYVITEINGKPIAYYKDRMNKIPKLNRLALKNHRIQFQLFKMLLNKGILIPDTKSFSIIYMPFRISIPIPKRYLWKFSPLYLFNQDRMVQRFHVLLPNPVLVDYSYDESNQIILKFADDFYHSLLCGVDYKNMMWCLLLPPITRYWRISKVYKYMYDLDEYTKVFNY